MERVGMDKPRSDMWLAKTGVAWAAGLVLALASYSVAAEPAGQRSKPAGHDGVTPREVGEMLYGAGAGAWGSPSRTAARLAQQRELSDKAATLRVAEFERQAAQPATPTPKPVPQPPPAASLQTTPQESDGLLQWLIPLGGGILIGLSVAGIYSWNRARGALSSASGRLLVVSSVLPMSAVPGNMPARMGVIPKSSRRRVGRSARSAQSKMTSFPRLRIKPSHDMQGDAIRQLQMLGILPLQLRGPSPGTGRPSWFANAITDEVQMYGGGSDPVPNYAYLEDAPRMLAQVEHQKAAEAMVWSNQNWQR
jgi:hypothetical protein